MSSGPSRARWLAALAGCSVSCATLLVGCADPERAAATWVLLDTGEVTPQSTSLRLDVTRSGCSGGVTGRVLDPVLLFEENRIVIRTDVEALPSGAYSCPSNDAVELDVTLDEPIGDRVLVDGACSEVDAAETSFCARGGQRWPLR